jgi:hypothetical protein
LASNLSGKNSTLSRKLSFSFSCPSTTRPSKPCASAIITPNQRSISQAELAEALEDDLYALRERLGAEAFPKSALDYLNDWASPDKA